MCKRCASPVVNSVWPTGHLFVLTVPYLLSVFLSYVILGDIKRCRDTVKDFTEHKSQGGSEGAIRSS